MCATDRGGRLIVDGVPFLGGAGPTRATAEQLALAWVAALPSKPQVVIGTNKPERITEAAASASIRLERQHWYELWSAAQGRRVP